MIVHRFPQRSAEWYAARAGCLLTASDAGAFLLGTDKRSRDARRRRILQHLCRECYTGGDAMLLEIAEKERKALDWNLPVQRGNTFEGAALEVLASIIGQPIEEVGLITTDDGLFGASTDGLIGETAIAETKVPLPETHLGYLLDHRATGAMVPDYLHQVHFGLAISGRETCHFYSHPVPYLDAAGVERQHPILHIVVRRDAFTESLVRGMEDFRREYLQVRGDLAAIMRDQQGKEAA